MSKIFGYLINMLPYMMIAVPVIVVFRLLLTNRLKKRGLQTSVFHEIGMCIFFMFLVGLASQTIIPKLEFGNGTTGLVNGNLIGEMNFIPGMVFADIYRECIQNGYYLYFVINFIGNICLFIPVGFCIPLLWENISLKKVVLIALSSSIFIELCQFPQARGTDIDDLWINTFGAILGFLVSVKRKAT